jgi:hypothetical protein
VPDDAVFINGEGGARAVASLFIKDAVVFNYLPLEIAEQGESHADVFLEAFVGRVAVHANSQNLCIALLEVGDISLIRLQLLRSTTGESQHVEGEHHILLATEIR